MTNIPDTIQSIVDRVTTTISPYAFISNDGTYTTIKIYDYDNVGFEVGMYLEFNGYPLRKQIIAFDAFSPISNITIERYEAIENKSVSFNILLNYYYGNPKEIQARIIEMSKDTNQKNRKFPLIALFLDASETRGSTHYDFEAVVNMAFIIDANKLWKPVQRLTTSFKEKLYPIYELFLKKAHGIIGTNELNQYSHTKTDRYFYSASEAKDQNTLAAYVDAIELNDFELKTFKTC